MADGDFIAENGWGLAVPPTEPITTDLTPDQIRQALDDQKPPQKAVSTKIPEWGWALIAVGALLIVAAAIAVPLVILLRKPKPTPTPIPVNPTPTIIRPVFPDISSASILHQVTLAPSDGLTKQTAQVCQVLDSKIGFVLCGFSSKSAFYTLDTVLGVASSPTIVISPATITSGANSFNQNILATPDGSAWSLCMADTKNDTLTCSATTWPSDASINATFFAGTVWSGVNIVYSVNASKAITMQNQSNLVCTSAAVPGLTDIGSQIASLFYTVGQTYAIFGLANTGSNAVDYVVYASTTSPDCSTVYTIEFDRESETLIYADMTYDGTFLLVLTTERLVLYTHGSPTAKFTVVDVLNLEKHYVPTMCALDRQYTSGTLWSAISTNQQFSVILPFTDEKFQITEGRQVPVVPATTFIDAAGPSCIHLTSNNDLFLLQADTIGNNSVLVIDPAKI